MTLFSCCGGPKSTTKAVKFADEPPQAKKSLKTVRIDDPKSNGKVVFADAEEDGVLEIIPRGDVNGHNEDDDVFYSCRDEIDEATREGLIHFMRDNLHDQTIQSDLCIKASIMEKDDDFSDLKYAPATVAYASHLVEVSLDKPQTLLSTFHSTRALVENKEMEPPTREESFSLRKTMVLKESLERPSIVINSPGYPGELTEQEMEKVIDFRRRLMAGKKEARELVLAQFGSETDEYALCRWLRSRKFDVDKTMEFVMEGVPIFKEGKKHKFYPNIDEAIGVPLSLVLSQFPYMYSGYGKNGCPVLYYQGGNTNIDGLECLINLDKMENFGWYLFMHLFKQIIREAREKQDNVRSEQLVIIDLANLSSKSLNSSLEVLKKFSKITKCFPEMMNRCVIINAPTFFSFAWTVVQNFLEKRTQRKISIFSNKAKGRSKLLELINEDQLLSDYGGKSGSFQQLLQDMNTKGTKGMKRNIIKMISKTEKNINLTIEEGEECRRITVYSRSLYGAIFVVKRGGELKVTLTVKSPKIEEPIEPYKVLLSSSPLTSGKVSIQACPKRGSTTLENFLVVADIY